MSTFGTIERAVCHHVSSSRRPEHHTHPNCPGQRDHSWGVRDWWQFPWNWTSGSFADGSYVHAARSIIPDFELFAAGYTVAPDGARDGRDGAASRGGVW